MAQVSTRKWPDGTPYVRHEVPGYEGKGVYFFVNTYGEIVSQGSAPPRFTFGGKGSYKGGGAFDNSAKPWITQDDQGNWFTGLLEVAQAALTGWGPALLAMGLNGETIGAVAGSATTTAATITSEEAAAAALADTQGSVQAFTQLENYFQETGNMDIGMGFGNDLPIDTDIFSFDASVLTPDTFVDNWDMLPDSGVTYQQPEVISNPQPGFFDRFGDMLVNKGANAVIASVFDHGNQGPIARAPANPIANRTPTRESAAGLRNPLNDYYNQLTAGGSNIIMILAILLLVTLGVSALGRR